MAANATSSYNNMAKNMADQLEKRQRDWQKDVEQMQQDFFKTVKVNESVDTRSVDDRVSSSASLVMSPSPLTPTYAQRDVIAADGIQRLPDGKAVFRARFDVRDFDPDEVSVRVVQVDEDDGAMSNKLVVSARHVEDAGLGSRRSSNNEAQQRHRSSIGTPGDGCRRSREFNRRVSLPPSVDVGQLVSRLAYDGLLTVEAPLLQEPYDVVFPPPPPRYESLSSSSSSYPGRHEALAPHPSATVLDQRYSKSNVSALQSQPSPEINVGGTQGGNVVEIDDYQLLKLAVDLGSTDFLPEDVRIAHVNRKLSVVARHETTSSITGKTTRRQFSRELDINELIDPRTLAATLDTDIGRLTIVAVIGRVTSPSSPWLREQPGSANAVVEKVLRSSGLRPSAMRPCSVDLR